MHKTILEYTLFFVAIVLLQTFLFDNLNLSVYVNPLVYVSFILLLPLKTNHGLLVFLGFALGVAVDFLSGSGGINTIASLATAFIRPVVLNLTFGKETVRDDGVASPREQGQAKWLKYTSLLVLFHCVVYFMFEAMTLRYFGFTLLRILSSSAITLLLVWFVGMLYPVKKYYGR